MSRVIIHQWDDTLHAQRMSSRIWTGVVALSVAIDFFALLFSKLSSEFRVQLVTRMRLEKSRV